MLCVRVAGPDGVNDLELEQQVVLVGRDAACDVVLASPQVSRRHLQLEQRGDQVFFRDLGSSLGVALVRDGEERRVTLGRLEPGDALRVGSFTLSLPALRSTRPLDDETLATLEAIKSGDEARRNVYADLLESLGKGDEAAYVRAELVLQGADPKSPAFAEHLARFRELTERVTADFRAGVARPAIERCRAQNEALRFEFKCPMRWDALELTAQAGVRHCPACKENVYFCDTVAEARALATRGVCVAVDVSRPRRPGDLLPQPVMMGRPAR